MRLLIAPAILLLGLTAAAAETKYQDFCPVSGPQPCKSCLESNVSIGKFDGAFVLPAPLEPSDAPHDQTEQAVEPPPSGPANAKVDRKRTAAPSVEEICDALLASAEANGLPVPFFANLIYQESGLQLHVVSSAGALGIAQFMPKVAAEVGLADPFDARQAIPASARFLHGLRQQFGNLGFTAAAYNAGAHRVSDWLDHGRALPTETKNYVVRVTGRSAEAWRNSPVADSELSFVRPLPCRQLPAFAEMEKTQMRLARAEEARRPPQPEIGPELAQIAAAASKVAQKVVKTVASLIAPKGEKKAPVAHHLLAAHKVAPAAEKIARNFRGDKHETARRQHGPHEKRRIASAS
jgi:Transglycosylase SLT domain